MHRPEFPQGSRLESRSLVEQSPEHAVIFRIPGNVGFARILGHSGLDQRRGNATIRERLV
uniref:Uncharacterized protein n=1 Tax=Rhizophora mucronata TaxID=61149 RepID=A0A2P2NDQ7_RHIMU